MTPIDPRNVHRILVRVNNWIGDVVMISPSLKALRETYPDARIEIVARPQVADCFVGHPWVDEVILHDPKGAHRGALGFLRLASALRLRRYDLAVLFQKAFGAALLAALARVPRRVGLDTDRRRFLLTHPIHETEAMRRQHHVDAFYEVARGAGAPPRPEAAPRRVWFPLDDASRDFAARFLDSAGAARFSRLAVFATGASKGPRAWHAERFARLAARLRDLHGAGILVVGGPGDRAEAQIVLQAAGSAGIDAVGATSVRQMAALIERCDLFVGNDSGPMHVAAALDVPVLALFGPGTPDKTAPYMPGDRFAALTARYPCSPCRQDFFKECEPADSGKPHCLESLTVEMGEQAIEKLMRAASARARPAPGAS